MPVFVQYTLVALGFVATIVYGYGQARKGRNESRLDTVNILSKDVDVLKGKVIELSDKIVHLEKIIEEKDKKLLEAISILQGRNPEMTSFMKLVSDNIIANRPLMDEIREILPVVKKLDVYLNHQSF